jgi:hypothetical protein
MQIIGFTVRLSSSLLWIQIYRLGVSNVDTTVSQEADFDLRSSFLSPATPAVVRQSSESDDILGGSIYDPAYYSSLFDVRDSRRSCGVWYSHLCAIEHLFDFLWVNFHLFVPRFFGKIFISLLSVCVFIYDETFC